MATPLLVIVTGIYAYVASECAYLRDWPLAIMYVGYAVANIGPIMLVNR